MLIYGGGIVEMNFGRSVFQIARILNEFFEGMGKFLMEIEKYG